MFWDRCRRAWNVCGYLRKTLNWLVRYIPVNQVGSSDLRCRKVEKSRETLLILSGTWLSGGGWVRYPRHLIKREERDTSASILCLLPSLARHLFFTYILWEKQKKIFTGLGKILILREVHIDQNILTMVYGNPHTHLVLLEDHFIQATIIRLSNVLKTTKTQATQCSITTLKKRLLKKKMWKKLKKKIIMLKTISER